MDYLSTGGTTGIATGRSTTGICNWKVVRTCEFGLSKSKTTGDMKLRTSRKV